MYFNALRTLLILLIAGYNFAFADVPSHRSDRKGYTWALQSKMDKPLNQDDFAAMEDQLKDCVDQDRKYWRVNDVKCDAVYTAKTYEEFADRVAAAHLRPLERSDYQKKSRGWNQYAVKEKKYDE